MRHGGLRLPLRALVVAVACIAGPAGVAGPAVAAASGARAADATTAGAATPSLLYTSAGGRVTIGAGPDRLRGGYGAVQAGDQAAPLPGGGVLLADTDLFSGNELDLAALGAGGAPALGFGDRGLVRLTTLGPQYSLIKAAAEPDGGALVLGYSNGSPSLTLVRVRANGSLDPAFAGGGIDRLAGLQAGADMTLEPDGSIALVATTGTSPGTRIVVAHLSAEGAPDPAFGTGGRQTIATAGENAQAVALSPGGDIVVLGSPVLLAALTPSGALDPGFGGGAPVLAAQETTGATDPDQALLVQPGGALEVLYESGACPEYGLCVARYTPQGRLDATFGSAGNVTLSLLQSAGSPNDEGNGPTGTLLPAPAGDTLVVVPTSSDAPEFLRLLPSGAPDPGFGGASGRQIPLDFGGIITPAADAPGSGGDFGETAAERADGSVLLPGTVEIANFTGAGSGMANNYVAHDGLVELTPSLQVNHAFGVTTPLHLSVRVGALRHGLLLVTVGTSEPVSASVRVTSAGAQVGGRDAILLYESRPTPHRIGVAHGGRLTVTVTVDSIDGQTRTARVTVVR